MPAEKNKIALIGAGHWGKNHLRILNKLGVLAMVCDADKNILDEGRLNYGGIDFVSDFSDICNNPGIEAVAIATPAATHYRLAKNFLLSGKHVLIEKPLALNLKEGEELVELAEKKNRILMVGHLLHYHPAIRKLKELIKSEDLGEIRYIWSNRLNFGRMRAGENVLWSFAPHDVSLIISILGMPKKVFAVGKAYLKKNISDTTLSILEYDGDITAHIFVSWINPFKEQKFSVIGSKGMAVFDGILDELVIYPHTVRAREDRSFEAIKAKGESLDFRGSDPLQEEIMHFINCIKTGKKPITSGNEGLGVLKVLSSCQESLNRNNHDRKENKNLG